MKTLISITLGALFAVTVVTSSFAQCSHNFEEADLYFSKIAAAKKKNEEAMSTYNPVKSDALIGQKKLVKDVEKLD